MSSDSKPEPEEEKRRRRLGRRILAMGYTEAKMRTNLQSKLDVLTETTAAYCDVFCPNPDEKSFFVANVDVFHNDKVASRTIAEFDTETKVPMRQGEPVSITEYWMLRLPKFIPAPALVDLVGWWKNHDTLAMLQKYQIATQAARAPTPDRETAGEFHESLRYAFDAIAGEGAYTLRVDNTAAEYLIATAVPTKQALGYCLSSSRAVEVHTLLQGWEPVGANTEETVALKHALESIDKLVHKDKFPSRLALLEALQLPKAGQILRSQSHSNVVTRTATLVRNPRLRSRAIPKTTEIAGEFSDGASWDLPRGSWAVLEKGAWPGGWPPTIFIMPLTNHEFIATDAVPETVAFWYVAVEAEELLDIEALLSRRFRASAVFSERLYQRYCQALADVIAQAIVKGRSSADTLNQACRRVSDAYRVPVALNISNLKADAQTGMRSTDPDSVWMQFQNLRAAGLISGVSRWGPATDESVSALAIKASGPDRPTHRTDVLLRLHQSLEVARGRSGGGSDGAAYESLSENIYEMSQMLERAMQFQGAIRKRLRTTAAHFGFRKVRWPDLQLLGRFFAPAGKYVCDPDAKVDRLGGGSLWAFPIGHDSCGTCACKQTGGKWELGRRAAYLAGAKVTGTPIPDVKTEAWELNPRGEEILLAMERLPQSLNEKLHPDAWEWIKRASGEATEKPCPASLVVLLLMEGRKVAVTQATLEGHATYLLSLPDEWELSLAGIAALACPKRDIDANAKEATVSIDKSDSAITFTLMGFSFSDWFDTKALPIALSTATLNCGGRVKEIASAYGHNDWTTPLDISRHPKISLNVLSNGDLVCTWRLA